MVPARPLVIVSNRGPVTFAPDAAGRPVATRGAGGLVSGLGPLVRGTDALWIAAAMTNADRTIAGDGVTDAEGFRVRLLAFDPDEFRAFYDDACNTALWFAHHGLFDPVYAPAWPAGWVDDGPWAAYRRVNAAFADAVAEDAPEGAVVLVQDYHLCLVAAALGDRRPDLRLVHFSHTPFATPEMLAVLPATVRDDLLDGLAAHDACGFHTARWVDDYEACARAAGRDPARTFVAPLGPDPDDLATTVSSDACRSAGAELDRILGERAFLVRVDRIELSKNILRGFLAYETLLETQPERHGTVVFGAFVYPSRAGVPDYDRYRSRVADAAERINRRFGTDDWTPILWDDTDDYPRSIAALARADAVLVNPIRDGLNLVAKEAVLVNDRDVQLLLSSGAGAWAELADAAWPVEPFDLDATARAIGEALDVDQAEGAARNAVLRGRVAARRPCDWLADQLAAATVGDR